MNADEARLLTEQNIISSESIYLQIEQTAINGGYRLYVPYVTADTIKKLKADRYIVTKSPNGRGCIIEW